MSALSRLPIGHYVPGESQIHHLDPRTKIVLLMICIFLIFIANTALSYTVAVVFVMLLYIISRISIIYVLRALKPLWLLLFITFLFHLWLNREGEILFEWGLFRLYESGLIQGVSITIRIMLLILISSLLTLTTKPLVLTNGLEKLMSPLKRIKFPAHEIALMISISLRFIPTILQELDKIMKAQMARGSQLQAKSVSKRAQAFVSILIPLFISSFQRAEDLALAMEARGYQGGEGRTQLRQLQFSRRDAAAVLVVLGFTVILLSSRGW